MKPGRPSKYDYTLTWVLHKRKNPEGGEKTVALPVDLLMRRINGVAKPAAN